jgi:hypothetical protein
MNIVSGYEIRKVRNQDDWVLILYGLDTETLQNFSAIRTVCEDPAELLDLVESKASLMGTAFPREAKKKAFFSAKGDGNDGFVTGHCVTIDRWFGLRGWTWLDVAAEGRLRINVPVLTHRAEWHLLDMLRKAATEEERTEAVVDLVVSTMALLREDCPMRGRLQIVLENGTYVPAEPTVDSSGSQELRA